MKKLIKSSILCFFTAFLLVSCNRVNYEIPDHKVIIEKMKMKSGLKVHYQI